MSARLLGLGTAVPDHDIGQAESARMASQLCAAVSATQRSMQLLPALYRRTTVLRRGSVLLENGLPGGAVSQSFFEPATSLADRGPGTAARCRRYSREAPGLARAAAEAALTDAGAEADSITHLVTVSCTGFSAPGIDAALINGLGLPASIQRTHIGFMGCHGAINGLRVASAFAKADPGARVLLCAVELCSLHFHYTIDPEQIVANALFADGAGAVVIDSESDRFQAAGETAAPRVAATGSCFVPDSLDAMTWTIGDHGFEMTLSPRVPSLLEGQLAPWLNAWLAGHGLRTADIGGWAVHPGGPRILGSVGECLKLSDVAMEPSRAVLAEHGNMSSPTVLFILDRLRRSTVPLPWLAIAFGPGLVAEVALIR